MVGMLLFGVASYVAGDHRLLSSSSLAAADDCQSFSQTGKTICGDFLKYWQDHGGLAQQGYPISDVFDEKSETDGITHKVQYFERAVFEAHPENQPPNYVLLSLLGSQKYKAKYAGTQPSPVAASASPPSSGPLATTTSDIHIPIHAGASGTIVTKSGAVKLTVVRFTDNAKSPNQYNVPKAGDKFAVLEIIMENVGTGDLPSASWKYRATDGFEYDIGNSAGFGEDLLFPSIAPGGKKQGVIVFEVASGASLKWIRYRQSYDAKGDLYFDAT
jgi:hypothetical protein